MRAAAPIAFYNHRRRHSALRSRSPAEYERTIDPTTLLPIAAQPGVHTPGEAQLRRPGDKPDSVSTP